MKRPSNTSKEKRISYDSPRWRVVNTPGMILSPVKEILNVNKQGSEINKVVLAYDGLTMWAIVRHGDHNGIKKNGAQIILYKSIDGGCSWDDNPYNKLAKEQSGIKNGTLIWNMAIAPDNPDIIVVACSNIYQDPLAQEVWISTDGGNSWVNTKWPPRAVSQGTDLISTMDISKNSRNRAVLVGTRDGTGKGTNNLQIMKITRYLRWNVQDATATPSSTNPFTGDVLVAKFSPNFVDDNIIVAIYVDGTESHMGTWLTFGSYDINNNSTLWQRSEEHIEIKDIKGKKGNSPRVNEIIIADLALPLDFSSKNPHQRSIYVSTDAIDRFGKSSPNRGVFRIDGDVVYTLMDNTVTFGIVDKSTMTRRVASIAYYGTCKVGKLMAGEVHGDSSRATVMTWFTVSPESSERPIWYPSLKPATGAGNTSAIHIKKYLGYGNAQVVWGIDGQIVYAATGSASLGSWELPKIEEGAVKASVAWPAGYFNVVPFDESAISISRNNGETWNQISLIDTGISKLNDVAPSADCHTIYLASVNKYKENTGFDSVWRSSINPAVVAPLKVVSPIGSLWERVYCRMSTANPRGQQTKLPILRLAPDKEDGEFIVWAAQDPFEIYDYGISAWSPDFGEYWDDIPSRGAIQDLALESSTLLYFLTPRGLVQKVPYTGVQWSTHSDFVDCKIGQAHMLSVIPEGNVLVGSGRESDKSSSPISYSNDGGQSFNLIAGKKQTLGNVHIAFGPDFANKGIIYAADDSDRGILFGCQFSPATVKKLQNGHRFFGLQIALTGGALYGVIVPISGKANAGVIRYLNPLEGLMTDNIQYEIFNKFENMNLNSIRFTKEPWGLKICGCLTMDTDTRLLAIDDALYLGNMNEEKESKNSNNTTKTGLLWLLHDFSSKQRHKVIK